MRRLLIVNADDFGFTRDVNNGILRCHREGIVTAATIMATGRAFRHAVELAKSSPTLDIGCHLVLIQEPGFPRDFPALAAALLLRDIDPHAEFSKQVNMILKAGLRPTHLDTHKHTHLIPSVLNALLRISEEYTIPWIRRPADFARDSGSPLAKQWTTQLMTRAVHNFDRKLKLVHARRTDAFTGFQLTGRLTAASLNTAIQNLPEGSTELMCHPGFLTEELARAGTRLKQARAVEMEALCSPAVHQAIETAGIQLASYRNL